MHWLQRHLKLSIAILALAGGVIVFFSLSFSSPTPIIWGVQFGKPHAEYLGLDWQQTYTALLDEVGVRRFRIAAYWNEIEREEGKYDFTDLDWQVTEAGKRGATILMAIGRRLPRWPECHVPDWAKQRTEVEQQGLILKLEEVVVRQYVNNPTIVMWQVENEPFLTFFGECPRHDPEFLKKEIALVRSLDTRPTLVTDSGELSSWRKTSHAADYFGTTMYRTVWNRFIGYWSYNYIFPPAFYRLKAWLVGKPATRVLGVELQAEPWAPGGITSLSLDEQRKSMDADAFWSNIRFAKRTGLPEHYLWGAEYWYWLKETQSDDSMWKAAQALFRGKT